MRQVALEHGINAGPPVVMVLTGQSASEMEPWRYGSKIWTMVMTIVQNTDCNKLNWSNFIQVNLALCHSVRNELREYLHLVCFAYIFVNTGNYCSNRVFKSDRSWPVIWPVKSGGWFNWHSGHETGHETGHHIGTRPRTHPHIVPSFEPRMSNESPPLTGQADQEGPA